MKMSLRDWVGGLSVTTLAVFGFSPVVQAAPSFGGWSVTNGDITLSTTTGYCSTVSCNLLVSGKGFAQYEVTDGATVYVYTIITEADATGDSTNPPSFFDESFIQRGNNTNGIMGHQHSADAATNFTGDTRINTGWAVTASTANLDIQQGFYNEGVTNITGDEFASAFHLLEQLDQNGAVTGKSMSVRQDAGLGDGSSNNSTDRQSFAIEYRSGSYTASDGSFTFATDPSTSLAWTASSGDEIMVTWIGQQINVADPTAQPDLSKFGYEGLVNKTTAAVPNSISTFSTTEPNISDGAGGINTPYDWDTLFGAAPVLQTTIGPITLP